MAEEIKTERRKNAFFFSHLVFFDAATKNPPYQQELRPLFDEYGEVERADVVIGRDGRSRGYGTVRFTTVESATAAIEGKHATELEGRTLTVKLDRFA